jgi:alcohol dehydrogenase class IV
MLLPAPLSRTGPTTLQGDLESRTMCALAATMSGIAYSNSHPNVCHAVGTPLTIYWDVEHGQAVGITLAAFLRWNAPAIPHKLPALWSALGVDDLDGAVSKITRIMTRCGLKTKLSELGIRALDMDTLVDNVRWDRVVLSPRSYGKEDARQMMSELL